jgi:putative transposase
MAQVLLPAIVDFSNGLRWMSIFQKLWVKLLKIYDDIQGINWRWQSLDSASIKAPLGGDRIGRNPTDRRGKLGTKRHVLTGKKKGIPLSVVVITAANTHDVKAAIKTLDSIVIKRRPTNNNKKKQQNLCLDKRGYYSAEI